MARVMVEDVPFISQLVKYPTGCESVSAVMVLNWAGVGVTVDEFIDRYLAVGTAPYRDENGKLHTVWKNGQANADIMTFSELPQ